jgi:hypothetical protein
MQQAIHIIQLTLMPQGVMAGPLGGCPAGRVKGWRAPRVTVADALGGERQGWGRPRGAMEDRQWRPSLGR